MWDVGGQESLRSSWSTYYVNTRVSARWEEHHRTLDLTMKQAVIMVIDSSDRERLPLIRDELHKMMEHEVKCFVIGVVVVVV